jgi:hypothetical protein
VIAYRDPVRAPAVLCLLLGALLAHAPTAGAQSLPAAGAGVGGEDYSRLIEVRRNQVALRTAHGELAQAEQLFANGLISAAELERSRTLVEQAQLNYQAALLGLLSLPPRITVQEAVKYQEEDGRKFVRLTVTNTSPAFDDDQFRLLSDFEGADAIPAELRTRNVRDVYVSLRDLPNAAGGPDGTAEGTTIALPYEQRIDELPYNGSKTLVFQLLRDVSSLVVATSYKGQQRNLPIQLEQAETESAIRITATQVSQEADLGSSVTYDLRLERSTVDVQQFQLLVVELPPQISSSFLGGETDARLSRLSFPAGVTQQTLRLRLYLPDRADHRLPLDQPLQFSAVALPQEAVGPQEPRSVSLDDLRELRAGHVRLELIPRGLAKVEITAASLFAEIATGGSFATTATVENTGSRELFSIGLTLDVPIDWQATVEPAVIPRLGTGEESRVALSIAPVSDVAVGEYEARLTATATSFNRPVEAPDKIFRLRVKPRSRLLGTVLVSSGLALTLALGVGSWIWLRRR